MEIKNIKQTCEACPSQWEAETPDKRGVYIRFRWGCLSICVSNEPNEHGLDGKEVYRKQLSDDMDGFISWGEVAEIIEKLPNQALKRNGDKAPPSA